MKRLSTSACLSARGESSIIKLHVWECSNNDWNEKTYTVPYADTKPNGVVPYARLVQFGDDGRVARSLEAKSEVINTLESEASEPETTHSKYIFIDDMLKVNPLYRKEVMGAVLAGSIDQQPLSIICSVEDIEAASTCKEAAGEGPLAVANSTITAFDYLQEDIFYNQGPCSGEAIESLSRYCFLFDIPLGLVDKLRQLAHSRIKIIIEDSIVMSNVSGVSSTKLSAYMSTHFRTLFNDAENAIHNLIDILAFVQLESLELSFVNSTKKFQISHVGSDFALFQREAHEGVKNLFKGSIRIDECPLYSAIEKSLKESESSDRSTLHLIFTSGSIPQAMQRDIVSLLINRVNAPRNPVTFITFKEDQTQGVWVKQVSYRIRFSLSPPSLEYKIITSLLYI
jgi:hypothetical protein